MLQLPILETARLRLRSLLLEDTNLIQILASDRSIADTTISVPHPYPDGEAARYISKQIAAQKAGSSVTFAIELKTDAKLIGIAELRDIEPEHSVAELSYWLAVTAWGKGYMSEAIEPLLDFGFETLSFWA